MMMKQVWTVVVWLLAITAVIGLVTIGLALGDVNLPDLISTHAPATPTPSASPVATATGTASATPFPTPFPTPTATPSATPTPAPTPTPTPFTITGRGAGDSRPFDLNTYAWSATYTLGGNCFYQADLTYTEGIYTDEDFLATVHGGGISGPFSGSMSFQVPFTGAYYLTMDTDDGCPWSLTFTPQ